MSVSRFNSKPLGGVAMTVVVAIGVALVATAALWPLPEPRASELAVQEVLMPRANEAPPLASFAQAWDVDLRCPLTDAPPANGVTSGGVAESGSSIRLVGTIVDPARPRGIFVTNLGQMELRGVGEKAGGAEVLRVDERSATVLLAGREVTLKVEKLESILAPTPPIGDPAAQPSADAGGGRR